MVLRWSVRCYLSFLYSSFYSDVCKIYTLSVTFSSVPRHWNKRHQCCGIFTRHWFHDETFISYELISIRAPLWSQPSLELNGTFQTIASANLFENSSAIQKGEKGNAERESGKWGKKCIYDSWKQKENRVTNKCCNQLEQCFSTFRVPRKIVRIICQMCRKGFWQIIKTAWVL